MHWINHYPVDGVICFGSTWGRFQLSVESNQTNTLVLVLFLLRFEMADE